MAVVVRLVDRWSPLPPKVHKKNGALYFVHKNKWIHLGRSAETAKPAYLKLAGDLGIPVVEQDFLGKMVEGARKRAKRFRLPFAITIDDVRGMFEKNDGRCALSSIKFDCCNAIGHKRRPWIPSLDRIDPRQGYTLENTRLVCFAMNAAMNAWGEDYFERLAIGFLKGRGVTVPA